jgi:hypothetical protein
MVYHSPGQQPIDELITPEFRPISGRRPDSLSLARGEAIAICNYKLNDIEGLALGIARGYPF